MVLFLETILVKRKIAQYTEKLYRIGIERLSERHCDIVTAEQNLNTANRYNYLYCFTSSSGT